MDHIFFIHSSAGGPLGCFHLLATSGYAYIISNSIFISFRYIAKSGIAGLYDSSIFSFFEKPPSILFSTVAAPIYTPTNVCSVTSSLQSHKYLLFVVFYKHGHSDLIVVLICISLTISNLKHLSLFLLVISMSLKKICLFGTYAHFFFIFSCMSSLFIFDINPLSVISLANIST